METGGTVFWGEVEGIVASDVFEDADNVLLKALGALTEVPKSNAELGCFSEVIYDGAVVQTGFPAFAGVVPNALGPVLAKLPNPPPPPNAPVVVGFVEPTNGELNCPNDG